MRYTESDSVELKLSLTSDIKKTIVAFANTKGGTVFIGIDDSGNIVGLQSPAERICEQLASMIHDGIKPDVTLFVEIRIERLQDREIVVAKVGRGPRRPYYLSEKGLKPSGVYVRLGNTSVPTTESSIRQMIIESDGLSYEEMRSLDQELTFIMAEEVFHKRGLSFGEPQMKTLGIIDRDGIFTNLGLLLSDQCQHSIKVAVFSGKDKDEFVSRKEFYGSIFKQVEEVYSFIELSNHLHATFEGLNRIDYRDYSESAIRESLMNAIIHRDYAFNGSTLISIFSDRMEIVSLGGLAPGLLLEDIFEGISQSRNPKLANVFYRLNYVEAYGTGIKKIQSECLKVGVTPEFTATNAAFRTNLPNRNAAQDRSPSNYNPNLETEVLRFIRNKKAVTRKEIQNEFDIKQTRSGTLLKSLEIQGLVIKRGDGRSTYYEPTVK